MDTIAVLIPCYNESKTIVKVVKDWKKALPKAIIYVYDNNSTDGTAQLADNAGAVVRYEHHQGKGNVVRKMFQEIDAKCYIMVDGDDTYPAEDGPEMAREVLEDHADMVVGDRLSSTYFSENKRPFHNFGNNIVRASINHMFKNDIKDIMTGFRSFSYRFAKSFPVVSKGFEIETEMTIHAIDKNMYVTNHVITYRDRPAGSVSKLNTISDGCKVLRTILRLFCDYRPMQFFGIISLILIVISALFFFPILGSFIATGIVLKFPTLIVCGFCVIAAIISFFAGLILSTIQHKERREFEFRLQQIDQWYKSALFKDSNYDNQ
jgi:glycosyltransferase involved in cell wall biosynthesis